MADAATVLVVDREAAQYMMSMRVRGTTSSVLKSSATAAKVLMQPNSPRCLQHSVAAETQGQYPAMHC
jgi:hypothetical protein